MQVDVFLVTQGQTPRATALFCPRLRHTVKHLRKHPLGGLMARTVGGVGTELLVTKSW